MKSNSLSYVEEMLLLLLHDEDGSFIRVPDWTLRYALSGAVLMELAFLNRIDCDLDKLFVIKEESTGDKILDSILKDIVSEKESQAIRFWVERTAVHAEAIREQALRHLIERGILEEKERKFLWVFNSRRYPVVDGTAEKEVKLRIFEVLFSDVIPDPRDVVLICLAYACGVMKALMGPRELDRAQERIDQVRSLDLIGQSVANAIWDIEVSISAASTPIPM